MVSEGPANQVRGTLSRLDLESIAEAAVAAPSADNRHQFELQLDADTLLMRANDAFASMPFHRRTLGLLSFGAVVENIVVRAARLGYRADVALLPERSDPSLIGRIRLTSGATESPLDAAIATRQTNRRVRFHGPRLDAADLASLEGLARGLEGISIRFHDHGNARTQLLSLVRLAESERFNVRPLHEELFSAVRFDLGWSQPADEGLPPGALGIEPGLRMAFAQLRRWPLMNALRRLGLHHVLGMRAAYLPCRLAPHLGVVYTSLASETGMVGAGRALERVWLEASRRGLAFQPLAASALLALPGYSEVPHATGETLRRSWRLLSPDTPMVVFRMGWARPLSMRAGRPRAMRFLRG